jgi:hypothetical protein
MTLEKKYSEKYFYHWLAMFSINQGDCSEESIQSHIAMYKKYEGDEAFDELKKEIQEIVKNNDVETFLEEAKTHKGHVITLSDLKRMMEMILKSK